MYVQFSDDTHTIIVSVFGNAQDPEIYPNQGEVEEDDPRYLAYINPQPTITELSAAARQQRDILFRTVSDPGTLMAQRALRLATTPEGIAYAQGKLAEMDAYAIALQGIAEQAGFPATINWPIAPVA